MRDGKLPIRLLEQLCHLNSFKELSKIHTFSTSCSPEDCSMTFLVKDSRDNGARLANQVHGCARLDSLPCCGDLFDHHTRTADFYVKVFDDKTIDRPAQAHAADIRDRCGASG